MKGILNFIDSIVNLVNQIVSYVKSVVEYIGNAFALIGELFSALPTPFKVCFFTLVGVATAVLIINVVRDVF